MSVAGIMSRPMKRIIPYLVCAAGIAAIVLLMPRFNAAQPAGARVTRGQVAVIADAQARPGVVVIGAARLPAAPDAAPAVQAVEQTSERSRVVRSSALSGRHRILYYGFQIPNQLAHDWWHYPNL